MKVQFSSGISFAIPIDLALVVINQLKQHKHVIRPYIGMRVGTYTQSRGHVRRGTSRGGRYSYGESMVLITDVEQNSPAHAAGLSKGDVIIEIDEKPVTDVKDVLDSLGIEVGQEFNIAVKRPEGSIYHTRLRSVPGKVA